MPKKVTGYSARSIIVDCKKNDSVDIKCGGPQYLGFDFYIDSELNIKKEISFIKETLEEYGKPCINIQSGKKLIVQKLWTRKMIEKEINNYRM